MNLILSESDVKVSQDLRVLMRQNGRLIDPDWKGSLGVRMELY